MNSAAPMHNAGDTPHIREGTAHTPAMFPLHHGGSLAGVRVAYRASGEAGGPVIAALGGISAGRSVTAEDGGWWHELAGGGKGLDSHRFVILGIDYLGGSGASSALDAGRSVSSYDQARALALVLDELGIAKLAAIVGASYGGMAALAFAELFPGRVDRIVVIGAAHRTHPQATAWRSIQRGMVREALERGAGAEGLRLARALAMATYRSAAEFEARFDAPPVRADGRFKFPVEEYLFARGDQYVKAHRPECFLALSESIDLHRVDPRAIATPSSLIGIRQDQIVPLNDMRNLRAQLAGPCELIEIDSIYGHDAFLKDGAQLNPILRDIFAQGEVR